MQTESKTDPHRHAPLWLVVTAFAIVYVIWGSTYLGIRVAVESIPPFLMAGSRHLVAGALLFAFARCRGASAPTLVQWRDAAIAGALMLVVGNGGVTWAEQTIPSGVAALMVALTPVWMVLFDWLRPGGVRPRLRVGVGLVIGFAGVGLLAHKQIHGAGAAYGWGVAALMAASICWAWGSVFNRTARKPPSPFLGVSLQMLTGGGALLALAGLRGEMNQFQFGNVTTPSLIAWLFLTLLGSLVAYTAYVWLLHHSTPARVATYAYVNPLIAVILGSTIGRETFTASHIASGALIILAVIVVLRGGATKPETRTRIEPAPPVKVGPVIRRT